MTLAQQVKPYQESQTAEVYYHDFYTNQRRIKFTQKTHDFNLICKATAPDTPITRKEQDVLANISNMILKSPNGVITITSEKFSELTENKKRQNNVIRKHLSHIIFSEHKKTIVVDGVVKRKVIVFKFTETGEETLRNITKSLTLAGGRPPAPIYKDKKNIKRNRSNESNFLDDSCSSSEEKIKTPKPADPPKPPKIKKFYQNQYAKPKTLAEEAVVTEEEHVVLTQKSGRDFTLHAQNEILKNMKKRHLNKRFCSRKQFIAWFSICLKYELRDVVKTANPGFYIKGNQTPAEIVEHTTMQERERYLNQIENDAIHHRSDETQLKAKWAGRLAINTAYNLLKNLRYWRIVGGVMEIYLKKGMDMLEMQKDTLLSQIQAVGAYQEIQEFKLIVENK